MNKNISQPSKLPHWTKPYLNLPNYLKEHQKISTLQTTLLNKIKSQLSKLPQWTKTNLHLPNYPKEQKQSQPSKLPQRSKTYLNLPNYLNEQKQISTFQTTSLNKNKSKPSKLPQRTINSCTKSTWYARRQHSYNICKDLLSHNPSMKNLNLPNYITEQV